METIALPEPSVSSSALTTVTALGRLAECRDPLAWEALLRQHGAGILRMAQRVTPDQSLCDDICQETLLQIRAHAARFVPPAPPEDPEAAARGWIMRIACRTAFKMLRTRQRLTLREARAAATVGAAPSAAEAALRQEESALVRRETAELPESLREPLCLRFYGELSYPELGLALGCSEEAAKKRVQRGVNELRSRLSAHGVALGLAALTGILGQGSAMAAEGAAAPTGAAPVLSSQQLAAWQALLKSSSAPALQGVVYFGGMTVMAKAVFGTAIVLLFAISGYQALSLNALRSETREVRADAADARDKAGALQNSLDQREAQLTELQAQLNAHKAEASSLRSQVAELQKERQDSHRPFAGSRMVLKKPQPGDAIANVEVAELPNAGELKPFNIAIPEIKIQALPDEAKKALEEAGIKIDDVMKDAGEKNTFQFVRDVDIPGGKMSVRVLKNGTSITTTHTQTQTNGVKPPEPPAQDPAGNF